MKNTFLIWIVMLSCSASALSLESISTSPADIDMDTKFYINAFFEGETCNAKIVFYIDDIEAGSKVPGCGQKNAESNAISPTKYSLECGTHEIRVELTSQGELIGNISKEIMVGNHPEITFEARPEPDKEILIRFYDTRKEEPAEDVKVLINLAGESEEKSYSTDSRGEIKFRVKEVGTYTLEIDDSDYCGEQEFEVRKTFTYTGPVPENPVAGESVSFTVPSGVVVKALDEEGSIQSASTAGFDGAAKLTLTKEGAYTILMAEESQIYWSQNATLKVSGKQKAEFILDPEAAAKEGVVAVQILYDGAGIPGVMITIEEPDNETYAYKTDDNGTVYFTPSKNGMHIAGFQDMRYEEARKEFEVKSQLRIEVLGETGTERDFTIEVKDETGAQVQGAKVSVAGVSMGTTGADGRMMIGLKQPGRYVLTAEKEGFWPGKKEVNVAGPLTLEITPNEPAYGDVIKISAMDSGGNEITAEYTVTKPDGTQERTSGEYAATAIGGYKVSAAKEGFVSAQTTFSVKARPLEIGIALIRDKIVLNTTSRGEPVPGITLVVEKPSGTETVKTDSSGMAEVSIKKDGRIKISANTENNDPRYAKITVVRNIVKRYDPSSLILALSAIAVVAIIGIVIVYLVPKIEGRREFETFLERKTGRKMGYVPRQKEEKHHEPYFRKKGKSRLSR